MSLIETEFQIDKDLLVQTRIHNLAQLEKAYETHEPITDAMPSYMWVEPTNACNAKCPLCPTRIGESSRPTAMMHFNAFKKIVDEVSPYTQSMNLWNIGEPFVNPKLFEMIEYAEGREIATRVTTNGFVLYKPSNIKCLINSGLTNLVMSLDGTTADVFNIYRVNVDFDRIMQGLRLLKDAKQELGADSPTVVWQFIAMGHNVHQIAEAQILAEELRMVFSLKSVNLDMVDFQAKNSKFLPREESLSRYNIDRKGHWSLKSERINDCAVLWHSLMINADGVIMPCCYDYDTDLVLGHFPEQSIREVWDGDAMQDLRQKVLQERMQFGPCNKCSVDDRTMIFLDEIVLEDR